MLKIILSFLFLFISLVYSKDIHILVIGKAGVGKSSLIDSFSNKKLIYTETKNIIVHTLSKNDNNYIFYDTPGLYNELYHDTSNVLSQIKQKINKINLIFICQDISNYKTTRNIDVLDLIENTFGSEIKKHTVTIFTKSNTVHDPYMKIPSDSDIPFRLAYEFNADNDYIWEVIGWYSNEFYYLNGNAISNIQNKIPEDQKSVNIMHQNNNKMIINNYASLSSNDKCDDKITIDGSIKTSQEFKDKYDSCESTRMKNWITIGSFCGFVTIIGFALLSDSLFFKLNSLSKLLFLNGSIKSGLVMLGLLGVLVGIGTFEYFHYDCAFLVHYELLNKIHT